MREREVQAVLLVRAFEEADPSGRLLTAHERAQATEQARRTVEGAGDGRAAAEGRHVAAVRHAVDGHRRDERDEREDGERLLAARAVALGDLLTARTPFLDEVLRSTRVGSGLPPTFVLVALALGLFTNALGPRRLINVLSVPMLGIIAWNLAVYVLVAWCLLRRRTPAAPSTGRGVTRLLEWIMQRTWRLPDRRRAEQTVLVAGALSRYLSAWRAVADPLIGARVRAMLHLGALMLAVGVVAGMYVRGLGLEYSATWESTFLTAERVDALLAVVLGPASAVTGIEVPGAGALQTAPGEARDWIHLWAASAVLFVVVPRALLMVLERVRARRLAARLPLDLSAGYYRRLLAAGRGTPTLVRVVPYSYHLEPREQDTLRSMLHDVFGARAEIAVEAPLRYGDEPSDLPARGGGGPADDDGRVGCELVLFGLGQSPESEVHGRFLSELRDGLGAADELLVVVDASAFRARMGDGERLAERERAWDRVVREAGLAAAHVDLSRPPDDEVLGRVAAALWRPGAHTAETPA